MAYIFHQDELPSLVSTVPGRERVFFVSKELTQTDAMLAGIMRYKKGAASPLHQHANCEHFYFIMEGKATVETAEGVRDVGPGDLIFFPAGDRHRLRAVEVAEIMNQTLCGAKNGLGMLRWLRAGERLQAGAEKNSHQLIYLMDGE